MTKTLAPPADPGVPPVTRRKVFASAVWSAVEGSGLTVLSFLSLIVFSRLLLPSDFGLFAMALGIVELLGLLVGMAFHDALVQHRDVDDGHFDGAFTASLLIAAALCGLCWLAAPLFAHYAGDPRGAEVLRALAVGFVFTASSSTLIARSRREFAFRSLALRSLIGRLSGAAIGLSMAFFGAGIWALVAQHLLMQGLGSLVLWITATRRPRLRMRGSVLHELAAFGAPALGALFTAVAIKRLLVIAAGFFLGASAAGFINIAFRTVDTFWTVSATAISQVSLPVLSRLQDQPERLRRVYAAAVALACTVLYAAFVGLALTAREVIELLYGTRWLPAAPYVTMLGFLVLLQAPRLFIGPLLTAVGKPGYLFAAYLSGLVYLLAAVFITRLPSPAMVIGVWIGCEILYLAVFGHALRRATGLSQVDQLRAVRIPLAAALCMTLAVSASRLALPADWLAWERLALLVAVGAIAYLSIIAAFDRPIFSAAAKLIVKRRHRPAAGEV